MTMHLPPSDAGTVVAAAAAATESASIKSPSSSSSDAHPCNTTCTNRLYTGNASKTLHFLETESL